MMTQQLAETLVNDHRSSLLRDAYGPQASAADGQGCRADRSPDRPLRDPGTGAGPTPRDGLTPTTTASTT